eukprot:g11710.t1
MPSVNMFLVIKPPPEMYQHEKSSEVTRKEKVSHNRTHCKKHDVTSMLFKNSTMVGEPKPQMPPIKKYPEDACKSLYNAIGYMIYLSDVVKNKEPRNEEKAMRYVEAAANYATVYNTTCKAPVQ